MSIFVLRPVEPLHARLAAVSRRQKDCILLGFLLLSATDILKDKVK
jgi:hypothetical protein